MFLLKASKPYAEKGFENEPQRCLIAEEQESKQETIAIGNKRREHMLSFISLDAIP